MRWAGSAGCSTGRRCARFTSSRSHGSLDSSWRMAPWCSSPASGRTPITCSAASTTPPGPDSRLFLLAMAVMITAWLVVSPLTIRHARLVQRTGAFMIGWLMGLAEGWDPRSQLTKRDISPYFWPNGTMPHSREFDELLRASSRIGTRCRPRSRITDQQSPVQRPNKLCAGSLASSAVRIRERAWLLRDYTSGAGYR